MAIVDKGIFKDYQTTREQAKWIQRLTGVARSHGCSFAESWSAVQVSADAEHLATPRRRDITIDDIVAATDAARHQEPRIVVDRNHAITSSSRGSPPQVRNGKIVGMLRDVAYRQYTVFWNSMRHDRRQVFVLAWRDRSTTGKANRPSRALSSHGCPPPLPQRPLSSIRTKVMTADAARSLANRVLALSKSSDQTRVIIVSTGLATRASPTRESRLPAGITTSSSRWR